MSLNDRGSSGLINAEKARKDWYAAMVMNGVYQAKSDSASSGEEQMSKEYYCTEIQKIFAKACADSLVRSFGHVLAAKPEFRADEIEAVAELHAVACVKMMKAFAPTSKPELVFPVGMSTDEKCAWLANEADQWRAIADRNRVQAMLLQAVEEGRFPNLQEAYRHFDAEQHQPPLAQASDGEVPGEESPEVLLHPAPSRELL